MEKKSIYNDFCNEVTTTATEAPVVSAAMSPSMPYEDYLRLVEKLQKKNKKLKDKDKKRKKKEKKRKKKEAKKLKKMFKQMAELEYRVSKSKPYDQYAWAKQIAVDCAPKLLDYAFLDKAPKKHKKKDKKKKGCTKYKMLPGNVYEVPEDQCTVIEN